MKSPHAKSLAREIGALRLLAANLEKRPLPAEELTTGLLIREGLGRVWEKADGIMAIRIPAHRSVTELTNCLLDRLPNIERGVAYSDIQTELLDLIETYFGRDPSTIGSEDAEALIAHFEKWFADKALSGAFSFPALLARHVRLGSRSGPSSSSLSIVCRRAISTRGAGNLPPRIATDSTGSWNGCERAPLTGLPVFPWRAASVRAPKR
jgi:hypothetical protein